MTVTRTIGVAGSLLRVAVMVALAVVMAACSEAFPERSVSRPGSSSMTPTPAPSLVDPTAAAAALRIVVPDLALTPYSEEHGLGVFPALAFAAIPTLDAPRVGRVLFFPSVAERVELEPRFGEMQILGRNGATLTWDGPTHSVWLGARNVLTEVVMPGGTFGEASPRTDPDAFLAAIRAALATL